MDARDCWILSAVIHAALILGAALVAIDRFVLVDGEGSGFSCSLGESAPRVDRIERPQELLESRIPSADPFTLPETGSSSGAFGSDQEGWSVCCVCSCGGAASVLVMWPRDIVNYFDRKLSMATSRRGVPRLKTHSRRCAFRDTGIEEDCTCGLIPPRS